MEKKYSKFLKLITLAGALPFIYGCGSSAGTGALLGFLFGGSTGIGLLTTVKDTGLGVGTELATLSQPEPASMLLLGSGLAVMTYFKSKANRYNKQVKNQEREE
ncbi:MAG: PEP-CTERM sorting domain-containing protein [Candidatus Omnitrophica bacterium]|nr:PEP-CTERM sorting domain-containing protein [Candidatus Omnitrophota bacterium]